MKGVYGFLFQVYPYVCFMVFVLGSLIRFDQSQYSWKSDSSQMLRAGTLRWGSNLFHFGVLFLFFGHLVGLFTPHSVYGIFMSAATKQMMAVVAGGIAGAVCFAGLSLLLYRRVFDPRIRLTSHPTDIAVLVVLWVQLVLGLVTLPYSVQHADGSVMLILADWAQRIVTLRPVDATALAALAWPYQVHIVLGMTIFLLFPFSRLVHVWSGFGTIRFLFRPHQVVRSRRLNVPAGHNQPREPGAI
ncbi:MULTISPECIES: respiratory nitrate reductase subunit gamma [unclassified Variovorax]|uniref:respiratory nitrate reductase subunit gamma n=1 Tax=unclassified Variovorax TaxID=663243 RepID=UPI00076C58E4|nr:MULTISPECIES: respiratory nitrate reductase subunit gamma [unclassified Variovorax]KWT96795.1 Respiratory nitrate reductase gamma chain [Variovorax sp. WDL1]PNG47222.1 Respiratory nitrate reductase 2 gamma chain [Variovorax sp. B2]PNG48127.1 Respiratory nitrate reductase 2 gamma chain [Variovorax sp. B4]VTV15105.1 Respiratory nitrate reductase 2 gamma chain [Variovorax sp. WDL1]